MSIDVLSLLDKVDCGVLLSGCRFNVPELFLAFSLLILYKNISHVPHLHAKSKTSFNNIMYLLSVH